MVIPAKNAPISAEKPSARLDSAKVKHQARLDKNNSSCERAILLKIRGNKNLFTKYTKPNRIMALKTVL